MGNSTFSDPNFTLWECGYIVIGCIILAFAIYYVIKTLKDSLITDNNVQGQRSAQIFYIIALFVKSIGLIVAGIMIIVGFPKDEKQPTKWDIYSIIPTGFPGYMTAVAYSYIFFSWCSVCYSSLEKNAVGFYHNSKKLLSILIYIIIALFVISFCFMIASSFLANSKKYYLTVAHNVESVVATIRDLACAVAFLFYLFKIIKLFESCCPSWESPETRLLVMLIVLIIALFLRPVCILTYILIFTKDSGYSEFSDGYFIVFLFECFITELLPLGFIGFIRLTSYSSYNTPVDDNIAAFLALE
ncbi:hypothetical protein TVAG_013250 [Trichomonas vaginalis G3]|uniref:THH1/TOM1/TOM3 domain-containing protein n=1 Tax=Trichomonas vaginalis (strain ATCC PRA-98 / G3) TaxID=412133 RepID=A2DD81_TRIV3|nr:hypothetical protein TVAGG3_0987330 [Trichomonas vaginalis G3]EAY21560.1 hypothetical protein TVAG_013250 [Trichomonas vaginalis G3]KAI5489773.1 hypothetical protein TVAGG3_0987330 [Trichomonas vaginalis G3]|eukprot:XP_001582546.1 hypothetical protein [Trichomonas vaginalis G3]